MNSTASGSLIYRPRFRGVLETANPLHQGDRTEPLQGVMLHYDDSSSDDSGVGWFKHKDCVNGYNDYVLDDGSYWELSAYGRAARHAGSCRPSSSLFSYKSANSAFYGIAVAARSGEQATMPQLLTVAWITRIVFAREKWPLADLWRITGHEDEAWQRGRRADPSGYDKKRPVMSKQAIRHLVGIMSLT